MVRPGNTPEDVEPFLEKSQTVKENAWDFASFFSLVDSYQVFLRVISSSKCKVNCHY